MRKFLNATFLLSILAGSYFMVSANVGAVSVDDLNLVEEKSSTEINRPADANSYRHGGYYGGRGGYYGGYGRGGYYGGYGRGGYGGYGYGGYGYGGYGRGGYGGYGGHGGWYGAYR